MSIQIVLFVLLKLVINLKTKTKFGMDLVSLIHAVGQSEHDGTAAPEAPSATIYYNWQIKQS